MHCGFLDKMPQEALNRMIPILHSPFSEGFYKESVTATGPLYCSITPQIAALNSGAENILPIGVDFQDFYPNRKISKIRKIGFLGRPDSNIEIKRPEMFLEIAAKSGTEPIFIYDKPYHLNNEIYNGIDMLLYCSTLEGVATGICEAAACKIPVISTKVGYANDLSKIKTFETANQAVKIIKSLNSEYIIEKYVSDLHIEVFSKYEWGFICEQYWRPIIEKSLKRNGFS